MASKCKHFALGFIAGKPQVCLLEALPLLIESTARIYHVGLDVPLSAKEEILDKFKQYKFCPKCGEKLDFEKVWKEVKNET